MTTHASEQQRQDVKAIRQAWFDSQIDLDPTWLVFIDDTDASRRMVGLRGRAPDGEQCVASIPQSDWGQNRY